MGGGESSNKSVICQLAEERNYLPSPQNSSNSLGVEFTLYRENVMVLVLSCWVLVKMNVTCCLN